MFAVKNMDALLKLKLDMVYRDLSMEEAQKRFSELTSSASEPAEAPTEIKTKELAKTKPKRKVVKAVVVKSK
jgi:hypothetical protein